MIAVLKYGLCLVWVVVLGARGCGGNAVAEKLPVQEYIAWLENPEHGLLVEKKIADWNFSLQYKTPEYVILQEEKRPLRQSEMDSLLVDYSEMQYYTFRIGRLDGKDAQKAGLNNDGEFYARLEYLSTPIQNDLFLIDGGDTLPCVLHHYERSYGIDPRASMVLGFVKKKTSGTTKTFYFDDHHFQTGPVLLTIMADDLAQIPSLTLTEN
jgi:hypothetical protein